MQQSFAMTLGELHVQAVVRHAGNDAVKGFAQMLFHPLGLFVLNRRALGGYGKLLAVGAMTTRLFQIAYGRLCLATEQVFRHKPMNHHIRITPYRRGEMCVVRERQAVVPDVVRRIERLRHRADSEGVNQFLFNRPRTIRKQFLDCLGS